MALFTSGKVKCLHTTGRVSIVAITDDQTGTDELFNMSSFVDGQSVSAQILHSMWLSILRDAYEAGNQVTIFHKETSGLIDELQIGINPTIV